MDLTTESLTSLKRNWIKSRKAAILAALVILVGAVWAGLTFWAEDPIAGFWSTIVGELLVVAGVVIFEKPIEKWFEAILYSRSKHTFSGLMTIVSAPEPQRAVQHQRSDPEWRKVVNVLAGMAVGKWGSWCNWTSLVVAVILLLASSLLAYERWHDDQPKSPLVLDAPTLEIFDGISVPQPLPTTPVTTQPSAGTRPNEDSPTPSLPIPPNNPAVPQDPTKVTTPYDPGKGSQTITNLVVNTEANAKATYNGLEDVLKEVPKLDTSSPDAAKEIEKIGKQLEKAQDDLNKLEKDDLVPADLRSRAGKLSNSISQTQKVLSDSSKSLTEKAQALNDLASKLADFLKSLGEFLQKLGAFLDQLFGDGSGLGKSLKKLGQGLRAAGQKVEEMAGLAKQFTQELGRQLKSAGGVVRIAKEQWERQPGGRPGPGIDSDSPATQDGQGSTQPRSSRTPSTGQVDDPSAKTPSQGSLPGPK